MSDNKENNNQQTAEETTEKAVDDWKMSVEEFKNNGCLINAD